jgi:hypothetical protein
LCCFKYCHTISVEVIIIIDGETWLTKRVISVPVNTKPKVSYILWLNSSVSKKPRYRHTLLKEDAGFRKLAVELLRRTVKKVHADAIQNIRDIWEYSLDPLNSNGMPDPSKGYPDQLPHRTLMGYFGEMFALVVAENFPPFQEKWEAPCSLFRFHPQAFEALERFNQTGVVPKGVVGRTGDDFLAFSRTAQGIDKVLVFESKCLATHAATKLKEAHENLAEDIAVPVSIGQIIEIMRGLDGEDAQKWKEQLIQLRLKRPITAERVNCLVYICGNQPARTPTWAPQDKPHTAYKNSKRKLEVVEVHLTDVPGLVREVYRGGQNNANP